MKPVNEAAVKGVWMFWQNHRINYSSFYNIIISIIIAIIEIDAKNIILRCSSNCVLHALVIQIMDRGIFHQHIYLNKKKIENVAKMVNQIVV